jgi:hypothetical protein
MDEGMAFRLIRLRARPPEMAVFIRNPQRDDGAESFRPGLLSLT